MIFSFPEISRLLDTLGIKMEELKSGELKAEPSPYKPVSDKVRAVSMEMVKDGFDWFTGLVAERRGLPIERVRELEVEIEAPKPFLLGRHLIDLGLQPSKRFGEIIKAIYELQLDGKVTNLAEAIEEAKAMIA